MSRVSRARRSVPLIGSRRIGSIDRRIRRRPAARGAHVSRERDADARRLFANARRSASRLLVCVTGDKINNGDLNLHTIQFAVDFPTLNKRRHRHDAFPEYTARRGYRAVFGQSRTSGGSCFPFNNKIALRDLILRTKIAAAWLAALVPFASLASTSIQIDARQNCLATVFGKVSNGASATFQLAPGRYVVSIASNNMSCSGGSLTNGCLIDTVMLQGGNGNSHWGVAINRPTVVDVPSTSGLFAYVSDDVCSDNTGQATLLIQTAY
ncbi:hypothetical protein AQ775_31065 [Burkholderia pseudomallei]|nr:hypothetical protein AQ775_31065 [Burkholderia pseudomallei]